MSRIADRFRDLRARGEKALIPFVTAGDPDLATTEALVPALGPDALLVINLSGRGDKDAPQVRDILQKRRANA